jgi:ornithine carbamoyltransferase
MALSRSFARALSTSSAARSPPHLLSLADLSVHEIGTLLASAHKFKASYKEHVVPQDAAKYGLPSERELLKGRTVALLFSKRSTRTRVASESATALLGRHST